MSNYLTDAMNKNDSCKYLCIFVKQGVFFPSVFSVFVDQSGIDQFSVLHGNPNCRFCYY